MMNKNENLFQKIRKFFTTIFGNKKLLEEGKEKEKLIMKNIEPVKNNVNNINDREKEGLIEEAKANRNLLNLQKQYLHN